MKDKIVQMPGTTAAPKETFASIVKQMAAQLPDQINYQIMRAKMQRVYYLELKSQGFTEAQALELTAKM